MKEAAHPDPANPHPDQQYPTADRFQILALDGGGAKGLFSADILAHLEQDLNVSVTDHFDLIAGTSTGGIIALALGAGLRPSQIVDLYRELTTRVDHLFGTGYGTRVARKVGEELETHSQAGSLFTSAAGTLSNAASDRPSNPGHTFYGETS